MKIKHIWIILLGLIVIGFCTLFYYTEKYTVKGIVKDHNVTADRMGNRTYSTIIICDDGYIREENGLNYYVLPIGSTAEIKLVRLNFNK